MLQIQCMISVLSNRDKISSPVAPCSHHNSKEDEQEGHIRDPHDDRHGVETKDSPWWGERGRYRFRPTGICAVLTGAWTRTIV